jgi:lysyl-tRNA synthetase, class I
MKWLNKVVDELISQKPQGEIIVESGISPSGRYHMGYLREIIICDGVVLELQNRGRQAKHIHFVDDLDGFRKVPSNLPAEYEKYLGIPLCDMPAPDGSDRSYADFALQDFLDNVSKLGVKIQVERSHRRYREGFFVKSIEQALQKLDQTKKILEEVSGRKLGDQWSPIQVNEDGYLKKRPFVSIDVSQKTIKYLDKEGIEQTTPYSKGEVKLDWRLDWPARWALVGVDAEPFGREHATKGGSYDTGKELVESIFEGMAPLPIPYEFINKAGDTKKMSASKGNGIMMSEVTAVLPPEISRFLVLNTSPDKTIFFDPVGGVVKLVDEFAELLAKPNKDETDEQLIRLCLGDISQTTISRVPFSVLVSSYQAALKDEEKTLQILKRTEYSKQTIEDKEIIIKELHYIDQWLNKWAPEEVKFELVTEQDFESFNEEQKQFFKELADKIEAAPADVDGEWFHKSIYAFKEKSVLEPKQLFVSLYQLIIGKDSGPRAGWFLSILPRDWLLKRLRLEG